LASRHSVTLAQQPTISAKRSAKFHISNTNATFDKIAVDSGSFCSARGIACGIRCSPAPLAIAGRRRPAKGNGGKIYAINLIACNSGIFSDHANTAVKFSDISIAQTAPLGVD
jgi:hypothetical protein